MGPLQEHWSRRPLGPYIIAELFFEAQGVAGYFPSKRNGLSDAESVFVKAKGSSRRPKSCSIQRHNCLSCHYLKYWHVYSNQYKASCLSLRNLTNFTTYERIYGRRWNTSAHSLLDLHTEEMRSFLLKSRRNAKTFVMEIEWNWLQRFWNRSWHSSTVSVLISEFPVEKLPPKEDGANAAITKLFEDRRRSLLIQCVSLNRRSAVNVRDVTRLLFMLLLSVETMDFLNVIGNLFWKLASRR
jgi:hypothetical protein